MGGSKLVFNQLGEGSKGTFLRSRQFMDDHGLVLIHSFIDSFASNDSNFLFPEFSHLRETKRPKQIFL